MKLFTTDIEDFAIRNPIAISLNDLSVEFKICEVDFEINQDGTITNVKKILVELRNGNRDYLDGIIFCALKTLLMIEIPRQDNFDYICKDALSSAKEE